jgi:diaminopimelate decarboxylase
MTYDRAFAPAAAALHSSLTTRALLQQIADTAGTPCYVYFLDEIAARSRLLRDHFGGRFRIRYAIKSNPNRGLLREMRAAADDLDVSSGGEIHRALDAGWAPERLGFTGPAKLRRELTLAVDRGVGEIVLESPEEAEMLSQIAASASRQVSVLVRLAPARVPRGFGLNMAGKPSAFGIDEEVIDDVLPRILALPHLAMRGLHVYSGTQCLSGDSIAENWEIFLELFRRVCNTHDLRPQKLIFGSGLGIPHHDKDERLDLGPIALRINPQLDALKSEPRFATTELVLEVGRFLVGEAGVYLTRVLALKQSRGATICVCDGGMNHHLAAAGHLGGVFQRNYRMTRVTDAEPDAAVIAHELVGPLCTTIDSFGRGVRMPALEVGDVIAIESSGAYGLSASPIRFISHDPPKEILVAGSGETARIEDVTEA